MIEWTDAKIKPIKTGDEFEYLVWVHDESCRVEYCWNSLCYYERGKWIYDAGNFSSKPTKKDLYVVKYCLVDSSIIWD